MRAPALSQFAPRLQSRDRKGAGLAICMPLLKMVFSSISMARLESRDGKKLTGNRGLLPWRHGRGTIRMLLSPNRDRKGAGLAICMPLRLALLYVLLKVAFSSTSMAPAEEARLESRDRKKLSGNRGLLQWRPAP